jgi:lipopolysaccharide/colanic/teichoic acid biosynthesis glycosyltransferase
MSRGQLLASLQNQHAKIDMSDDTLLASLLAQRADTGASPLPLFYSLALEGSPRSTLIYAAQFIGKQLIDLIGASLGLLLLGPLMLIIALLIRLDSKGSALFLQQRRGLGGKPFWMWKFRTMVEDAEARLKDLEHHNESQGRVLFKIRQDPRVTRVGWILRRTNLDELPQLFNILQGHMSFVGPRPLPLRDCTLLQEVDKEQYVRRLSVLPGLTGPWQVSDRIRVTPNQMLAMDMEYIDNWSILRDLRLIARTVLVVLTPRGAC